MTWTRRFQNWLIELLAGRRQQVVIGPRGIGVSVIGHGPVTLEGMTLINCEIGIMIQPPFSATLTAKTKRRP